MGVTKVGVYRVIKVSTLYTIHAHIHTHHNSHISNTRSHTYKI